MTIDTAALRELCERATPGPWRKLMVLSGKQDFFLLQADGCSNILKREDADFAITARTALPELLDKVEKLEKDLAAETTRREDAEAERDTALSALNTERTMREAAAAALTEWQGGIKQGQRIIDAEAYKRLWKESQADNARLREALEFYADRGHWVADYGCVAHSSRATEDCGERARSALHPAGAEVTK